MTAGAWSRFTCDLFPVTGLGGGGMFVVSKKLEFILSFPLSPPTGLVYIHAWSVAIFLQCVHLYVTQAKHLLLLHPHPWSVASFPGCWILGRLWRLQSPLCLSRKFHVFDVFLTQGASLFKRQQRTFCCWTQKLPPPGELCCLW